jgi:hypothetical protein
VLLEKAYVAGGLVLLPIILAVYAMGGMKLFVNLVCFIYPAYASLQVHEELLCTICAKW